MKLISNLSDTLAIMCRFDGLRMKMPLLSTTNTGTDGKNLKHCTDENIDDDRRIDGRVGSIFFLGLIIGKRLCTLMHPMFAKCTHLPKVNWIYAKLYNSFQNCQLHLDLINVFVKFCFISSKDVQGKLFRYIAREASQEVSQNQLFS